MQDIVNLKISVGKLEEVLYNQRNLGLIKPRFVLLERRQEVVTDRLLVSDEGVRVLDVRE